MPEWVLSQSAVEQGCLHAALKRPEGPLVALASAYLSDQDFTATLGPLGFIRSYVEQYHVAPTDSVIAVQFPEWNPAVAEFDYWTDLVRKYSLTRKAHGYIAQALETWSDPALSISTLIQQLSTLTYVGDRNIVTTDGGAQLAFDRYKVRSEAYVQTNGAHIWGIPTTFGEVNATHLGWLPGELIGIYARPTVGKSWKLLDEGACAWTQGHRVLLVSPEMPTGQVNLRIYAMLAHRLGLPYSHQRVYAGDPLQSDSFEKLKNQLALHERWWTVDSIDGRAVGLGDLDRLCQQFAPTILLLDGISLLHNERNWRSVWEEMRYNSYGLKHFATRANLPVIVTHQAVNTSRGIKGGDNKAGSVGRGDDDRMPSLNDAAYGDSFVQACSTVITMAPDADRPDLRWYSFRKLRERDFDSIGTRRAMYWNVDAGEIRDLAQFGTDKRLIAEHIHSLTGRR